MTFFLQRYQNVHLISWVILLNRIHWMISILCSIIVSFCIQAFYFVFWFVHWGDLIGFYVDNKAKSAAIKENYVLSDGIPPNLNLILKWRGFFTFWKQIKKLRFVGIFSGECKFDKWYISQIPAAGFKYVNRRLKTKPTQAGMKLQFILWKYNKDFK